MYLVDVYIMLACEDVCILLMCISCWHVKMYVFADVYIVLACEDVCSLLMCLLGIL